MAFAKLDDGFPEHDKIDSLSDKSFRLHVTAICHSSRNLTDGRISERALKVCAIMAHCGRPALNARELCEKEVWHAPGETCSSDECAAHSGPLSDYVIHDFMQCNRSADEVQDHRKSNRDRQREYRRKQRESNAVTDAVTNGDSNDPLALPSLASNKDRGLLGEQPSNIGFLIDEALKEVA